MISLSWLLPKAKRCGVYVSQMQGGWHSHLAFRAKVLIWRVIIGGLLSGPSLRRRGLGLGMCCFCTSPLENNIHKFIKCPIMRII